MNPNIWTFSDKSKGLTIQRWIKPSTILEWIDMHEHLEMNSTIYHSEMNQNIGIFSDESKRLIIQRWIQISCGSIDRALCLSVSVSTTQKSTRDRRPWAMFGADRRPATQSQCPAAILTIWFGPCDWHWNWSHRLASLMKQWVYETLLRAVSF